MALQIGFLAIISIARACSPLVFCLCSVQNYFFLQNPKQARAEQEPLLCPPVPTSHSTGTSPCWGDTARIKHPSCAPLSAVASDCSSRETLGCLKSTDWPRKALENCCFLANLFLIAAVPFQNGASVGGISIGDKLSPQAKAEFSCTHFSNKLSVFIFIDFCGICTHHEAQQSALGETMVWLRPSSHHITVVKGRLVQYRPNHGTPENSCLTHFR